MLAKNLENIKKRAIKAVKKAVVLVISDNFRLFDIRSGLTSILKIVAQI